MTLKIYRPNSSARRRMSVITSDGLTKKKPERKLIRPLKSKGGRGNLGKITVRHQGGGAKRRLRIVDFNGDKFDVPAKVTALEYDPNRNARLALLIYADGEKRYIIAPAGLQVGDEVFSSKKDFKLKIGNRFPLALIPPGTIVHNVEIEPGKGGKLARAAGSGLTLMVIEGNHAQLKLPSGEIRLLLKECLATIGQVSNIEFRSIWWGKAGRMRHKGIRPSVRGKAMNPVDHPHGGGEGKSPIGIKKGPKNVYGKKALGVKTRRAHRVSDRLIIKRRR